MILSSASDVHGRRTLQHCNNAKTATTFNNVLNIVKSSISISSSWIGLLPFFEFVFELQFQPATEGTVVSAALHTGNHSCAKNDFQVPLAHKHSQEDANVWTKDAYRLSSCDQSVGRLCSKWQVGTHCIS